MHAVAAFFASIITFMGGFFAPTVASNSPVDVRSTQPAAAAATQTEIGGNPFNDPAVASAVATASAVAAAPTPSPSQTIINQRVIERIIERIVPQGTATVSTQTLAAILADFEQSISSRIAAINPPPATIPAQVAVAGVPGTFNFAPASQRIDQITNTAINTPTIAGGSISGASAVGANSGSFDTLSAGTLNLSSALTGSDATFSGTLTAGTLNVAGITSQGALIGPYITATSTTATSTLAGGLTAANGSFSILQSGKVGIGTTTPGSLLSLNNIANFTTATSTFYSTGGINLAAGCFAKAGNCLSFADLTGTLGIAQGGTGTTTQVTNGVTYFDGTKITSGSGFFFNGTNVGIGTSTPEAPLTVSGNVTTYNGYLLLNTTGQGFGLATNQDGSGIRTSNTNFAYNKINILTDNIDHVEGLSRDPMTQALSIDLRKNSTGAVTRGGIEALYVRASLESPIGTGNRNQNYVAGRFDITNVSGDGGASSTLSAGAIAGATSITLTSASGFADNDPVYVMLDNGRYHKTTATVSGVTLTLAAALPSAAAAGNMVYSPRGAFFSLNPFVTMSPTSTNMLNVTGAEVNTSLPVGASALKKSGWDIVQSPTDKVSGTIIDCALCFSNQGGAVGWDNGILLHWFNGTFPIKSTGTLFAIDKKSGVTPTIANGFDISSSTITGDAFKFENGSWSGAGILSTASLALTGSSGTTTIAGGQALQVGAAPTYVAMPGVVNIRTESGTNKYGLLIESGDSANSRGGLLVYGRAGSQTGDLARISALPTSGFNLLNVLSGENTSGSGAISRFLVTASGNVGIGTTTPRNKLSVLSTGNDTAALANAAITITGDATNFYEQWGLRLDTNGNLNFDTSFGGTEFARITALRSGNVGIGTTTPTAQLSTTGTVRFSNFGAGTLTTDASGNLSVSSDERLKTIDGAFSRGLADVLRLSPIQYHWNPLSGLDKSTQYAGFSAQNVQTAIPEAVGSSTSGYLTLQDRPLIAALVNAVKEIASITGTFKDSLIAWLGDAANGIGRIRAHELCADDVCVTRDQLAALLAVAGQSNTDAATATASTVAETPIAPVIGLNGNATSTIEVGDTYNDLGARIVAPDSNLNLGIVTVVDGATTTAVSIDTSAPGEHTILYTVTSPTSGLTGNAMRAVVVSPSAQSPEPPSPEPANDNPFNTPPVNDNVSTSTLLNTEPAAVNL